VKKAASPRAVRGLGAGVRRAQPRSTENLLEPEKAFRFSAQAIDGGSRVRFAIAEATTSTVSA